MNKFFVFFLILLCFLAFTGELFLSETGYVLVNFHNLVLETSVWVLLLSLIIFIGIVVTSGKTIRHLFRFKGHYNHWRTDRKKKVSFKHIDEGILHLLEGNWSKAQRHLQEATVSKELALVGFLGLAKTAQSLGETQQRDHYLKQLKHLESVGERPALSLVQADFYLQSGQWAQARSLLEPLQKKLPKNTKVLKGLIEVYSQEKDWLPLQQLIPQAQKQSAIDDDFALTLKKQAFMYFVENKIQQARLVKKQDEKSAIAREITKAWSALPKELSHNDALIIQLTQALEESHFYDLARKILEAEIKRSCSAKLISHYGQLSNDEDIPDLIQFLEREIGKMQPSAEYYYSLGKLYSRSTDWVKAAKLLEHSVKINPMKDSLTALGSAYQNLQQYDKSALCFQKALHI